MRQYCLKMYNETSFDLHNGVSKINKNCSGNTTPLSSHKNNTKIYLKKNRKTMK